MNVNSLKHLSFPTDRPLLSLDQDAQTPGDAAAAKRARPTGEPPLVTDQVPTGSVVLKISVPGADDTALSDPTPALYSDGRKSGAVASDDTEAMARAHQAALERNAGVVTRLTVGNDGVMVAKPKTAFSAHESDFVSFAVSAMREFADEAQRAKSDAKEGEAAQAPLPHTPQGNFFGIQKLAAKLHLFA